MPETQSTTPLSYDLASGPKLAVSDLLEAYQCATEGYRKALHNYGLVSAVPRRESLEQFKSAGHERQKEVIRDILEAESSFSDLSTLVQPEASKLSLAAEKLMVRQFIFRKGWQIADSSIFDLIDEDDIIEVFNDKGVQIYRSWSFFKFCSYSVVDLVSSDWNTLFARPSWIVEQLMKLVPAVFAPGAVTMPYNVDEYLVRERISEKRNTLLFKMKYVSPLISTLR